MFVQTWDIGVMIGIGSVLLLLTAIITLSWREDTISYRRGMIGAISGSSSWLLLSAGSFAQGYVMNTVFCAFFGLGGLFCCYMMYRAHSESVLVEKMR